MKTNTLLALVALSASRIALADENCLQYGPEVVTLEGRVVLETFFGPPGYGENPKTDSRETQALLVLNKPICTVANPRDYEEAEKNQNKVTLVPNLEMNLSQYSGSNVLVKGTLFHSITGHHHTPVLISVQTVAKRVK